MALDAIKSPATRLIGVEPGRNTAERTYFLMLRRRAISGLELLQLLEGTGESCLIEFGLEGEMVQMRSHPQTFHLDKRPQTGEEMVALGAGRLGRRFGKPEIALDGLV